MYQAHKWAFLLVAFVIMLVADAYYPMNLGQMLVSVGVWTAFFVFVSRAFDEVFSNQLTVAISVVSGFLAVAYLCLNRGPSVLLLALAAIGYAVYLVAERK